MSSFGSSVTTPQVKPSPAAPAAQSKMMRHVTFRNAFLGTGAATALAAFRNQVQSQRDRAAEWARAGKDSQGKGSKCVCNMHASFAERTPEVSVVYALVGDNSIEWKKMLLAPGHGLVPVRFREAENQENCSQHCQNKYLGMTVFFIIRLARGIARLGRPFIFHLKPNSAEDDNLTMSFLFQTPQGRRDPWNLTTTIQNKSFETNNVFQRYWSKSSPVEDSVFEKIQTALTELNHANNKLNFQLGEVTLTMNDTQSDFPIKILFEIQGITTECAQEQFVRLNTLWNNRAPSKDDRGTLNAFALEFRNAVYD